MSSSPVRKKQKTGDTHDILPVVSDLHYKKLETSMI